ncbi:DNA-binding protein [Chryseobacterium sp. C-71]|uniref:PPC domain-containing DNA-binding protein n=1 Tax=Chryseobacterium sp. C-71 TaxID=2893882 RepID=UPI001E2E7DC1|nr:PPC domain-containing DNA-binding protein [Chryseobacterium sp. C-71]UFH32446.1 DNA-binding protein [Chryseobacterium sp. C-71]
MKERILEGELWTAKKIENNYIVSIKDQSSIVQALNDFVLNQNIKSGQVTGIGAVSEATLRFFDFSTKDYVDKKFDEQMEVTNISGNVSVAEDKPLLHLHITLGRQDYSAIAGHLQDAKIRGAGEFFFYPMGVPVFKTKNEDIGILLYDFEKSDEKA